MVQRWPITEIVLAGIALVGLAVALYLLRGLLALLHGAIIDARGRNSSARTASASAWPGARSMRLSGGWRPQGFSFPSRIGQPLPRLMDWARQAMDRALATSRLHGRRDSMRFESILRPLMMLATRRRMAMEIVAD
jgi:hypothetical protein